ncbi:RNA-directed DNA polymerase [Massilia sp. UMI-21]|nr:RNA-directed DNA polymerase [Massilia sp. UMI-21]
MLDAVRPHAEKKNIIKIDLLNFFPSVDRDLVAACIRNSAIDEISDLDLYLTNVAELVTVNGYLPPGFATSPPLSNACLIDFDNILQDYCSARQLVYTRYSDDIVISGDVKEEVVAMPSIVFGFLNDLYAGRFTINADKIKLMHRGCRIALLGLQILPNGRVTLGRDLKNKIESLLYFYWSNQLKLIDILGADAKKNERTLVGYLNHARVIDTDYFAKLEGKFGASAVEALMNSSDK